METVAVWVASSPGRWGEQVAAICTLKVAWSVLGSPPVSFIKEADTEEAWSVLGSPPVDRENQLGLFLGRRP